ncbi:hypothetical protein LguiA_003629 [Lonicera macranthoides]
MISKTKRNGSQMQSLAFNTTPSICVFLWYLLCTVGSLYIKSKEAPTKDVLKDLLRCAAVFNIQYKRSL